VRATVEPPEITIATPCSVDDDTTHPRSDADMAERRKAHKRESQTAESQTAGENATSRMWIDWQQSAKNAVLFFYFRLRICSEPYTREAFGPKSAPFAFVPPFSAGGCR
jgi:hypothetical protein